MLLEGALAEPVREAPGTGTDHVAALRPSSYLEDGVRVSRAKAAAPEGE
jgi:hypothetical protein